jgi:hypothetical protein
MADEILRFVAVVASSSVRRKLTQLPLQGPTGRLRHFFFDFLPVVSSSTAAGPASTDLIYCPSTASRLSQAAEFFIGSNRSRVGPPRLHRIKSGAVLFAGSSRVVTFFVGSSLAAESSSFWLLHLSQLGLFGFRVSLPRHCSIEGVKKRTTVFVLC